MIGTIRKHSKWLWWAIIAATVVTFVFWGVGPSRSGFGGGGAYGTIYGHKITQQDYVNARNDFYIDYWFNNHEWPDQNPNLKKEDLQKQIYLQLMLTQKAVALDIHVSDQAAAAEASALLRSLGSKGQSVPIVAFVNQILQQEHLTANNFEHFVRNFVAIRQLFQTVALPGALITPQEAAAAYQREYQKVSAQIVFFSASNYLSQVAVTPAAVAQFYTNYMAQYRLPDRVQVNYVKFNLSNYLAQAETELTKSNLDAMVEADYERYGTNAFPDANTPEAAKAKFREAEIHHRALADAQTRANAFATKVFDMEPVKAQNLATVAKQEGLTVHLTAPFSSQYGPEDFSAPAEFTKDAFGLSADDPLAGPVPGPTGLYVMALAKKLPSEIPPLDSIRGQVRHDYRVAEATAMAQRAGTNFAPALARQLTNGHTFASACVAAGFQPETLPPFSLSTPELPALAGRVELTRVQQAVFSLPAGHTSGFEETADGGFIVYVQSRLPVDQTTMKADLPQFTAQLRSARENTVFNQWLNTEFSQQLPAFARQISAGTQ